MTDPDPGIGDREKVEEATKPASLSGYRFHCPNPRCSKEIEAPSRRAVIGRALQHISKHRETE